MPPRSTSIGRSVNQELVTTGDWERLIGEERDCME